MYNARGSSVARYVKGLRAQDPPRAFSPAVRALLSAAATYCMQRKKNPEESIELIGQRVGSKLSLLYSMERSSVQRSYDSIGKFVTARLLPTLGLNGSTYGISKRTGRLVVRLPSMWYATPNASDYVLLPVIPAVIKRILAGWGIPVSTEVQCDKNLLLVITLDELPE